MIMRLLFAHIMKNYENDQQGKDLKTFLLLNFISRCRLSGLFVSHRISQREECTLCSDRLVPKLQPNSKQFLSLVGPESKNRDSCFEHTVMRPAGF